MLIDQFYSQTDKEHFYLGMISSVFRDNVTVQVENLSLLGHRKIRLETLIPNTINYFVVIDNARGVFIGEIFQSKINSTNSVHESLNNGAKEDVYPETSIDIFGLLVNNKKFILSGFKTVGITDKVYIANETLIKTFLDSVEVNNYEGQSSLANLATLNNFENEYLSLKPNTLFDRHLMAIGTTNSGKSTSALTILDKLVSSKKKVLLIDPTGEYQDAFTDDEVNKLRLGENTVLPIDKVSLQQWSMIFQTNDGSQDTELMKAIKSLRYQALMRSLEPTNPAFKGIYVKQGKTLTTVQRDMEKVTPKDGTFQLSDLPHQIIAEAVSPGKAKNQDPDKYYEDGFRTSTNTWLSEKVRNVLDNSNFDSFFGDGLDKKSLISAIDEFFDSNGKSLYINSSEIGTTDGIGQMIVDLVSNYLINTDKDRTTPFVVYIDEVHRYMNNRRSEYQLGLISIAREGRKKGIFLFLTTQNPKDVPDVLLGQIGTMIIHRITHSEELRAIQNQVQENTLKEIRKLNQGEAIITSVNLLQDLHVKFRKSYREHKNNTPLL